MIATNAAIAIIPLLTLGIIAYNIYFSSTAERMTQSINVVFQQMNGRLDEYFDNLNSISKATMFNSAMQEIIIRDPLISDSEDCNFIKRFFASVVPIQKSIKEIYIITKENRQVGTGSMLLSEELLDFINSNKETILKNNNISFLIPEENNKLLMDGYVVLRNIRSLDSLEEIGIGVFLLNRSSLVDMIKDINTIANFDVYIFDSENNIVASSNDNNVLLINELKETTGTDKICVNGSNYMIKSSQLNKVGWRLVAALPEDELYKEGITLKRIITFIVIIIFIAVISITLMFNFSITKPIKKLADAFNQVANGNLKVKVNFKRKNEITAIADNFNYMLSEINNLTRKIINTQQILYEIEIEKTQAELYALQSQINSHFLYNTLSCIRAFALNNVVSRVEVMIKNLIAILRYASGSCEHVTLSQEVEYLNNYMQIQKARFDIKLKFMVDVSDDANSCKILRLILQPIIENSICHGFKNQYDGFIKISAKCSTNYLIIKVFDNGAGMSEKELEQLNASLDVKDKITYSTVMHHIGLANIQKRIKTSFGEMYGISVKSWSNIGTVVIFKLPIKEVL